MHMTRTIRTFLCFVAMLMCLVTICGCGGADTEPTSEPTAGSTQSPTAAPSGNDLKTAREKTRVGAWYSLWYDSLTEHSFWDNEGTGREIYYKPSLPDGTFGRYDSNDSDIIQFHLEEIADAGIDFLIFDQTNKIDAMNAEGKTWINVNSIKMAKAIWNWNKVESNRKIQYCSAIGAFATVDSTGTPLKEKDFAHIESEAKKLYERYLKQKWGTEIDHVYVDGKPLLVLFTITQEEWEGYAKNHDTPYTDMFTLRYSVGHAYEPGMWGWVIPFGTTVTEDVATIIPGWFKYNHNLEKVYRERGATYKANWEIILSSNTVPNFIVINSINEYAEHTAVFPASTADFPSNYAIERWLNADGEEDPYMYWNMTKLYIQKYRNGDRK